MNKLLFLSLLLLTQSVFGQFSRPRVISACELCEPRFINMVDLDKDGDKDIVATSLTEPKIVWYRNDGGAGFSSQLLITRGINSLGGIADLDGDQDIDIIAVSLKDKALIWYKNNGQFNFSEKSIIDSSNTALQSVAIADLDGDQYPDLVVSLEASFDRTVWYKNDGKGNFSKPRLILNRYTGNIITADLDEDGDQDVLLDVYWYANDGEGNFTEITQAVFNTRIYATAADLNNDKRLDIITYANDSPYYNLYWYKNEGNGQFSKPMILEIGLSSAQFAIGDLDGDGSLDIALGRGGAGLNELRWKKNDGQGNFTRSELIASNGVTAVQAADINNDQRLDLITVSMQNDEMHVYRNNPDLSFTQQPIVKNLTNGPRAVHSGDFDNDGHVDVLVASAFDHKVSWFKNDGKKGFAEQTVVTDKLIGANSVNAADFDKDGDLDIIASGSGSVYFYRNTGRGLFSESTVTFSQYPNFRQNNRLSIGDIDRDGNQDIFYMAYNNIEYSIYWHKNDGKGNFNFSDARFVAFARGGYLNPPAFCAADMDNDGDLDMVTQVENSRFIWFRNDGAGNFSDIGPMGNAFSSSNPMAIFPADFDGDNDIDILSVNYLYWHENRENGRFFDPLNFRQYGNYPVTATFQGTKFANIGDVDKDGDQDVLVATELDHKLNWYRNNGRGVFSKAIPIATGIREARPMHLVDLDKDGDLDIVTFYEDTDKVVWYENLEPLPNIEGLVFWDKNGNGKLDTTEQALTNLPVNINPEALSSYTDFDGKFRFFVSNGQYQLTVQTGDCWEPTTGSLSYSIRVNNNVVDTIKFALRPKGQSPRPSASLHAGPTRCGFEVPFWLTVQNTGCGLSKGRYAAVLSPLVRLISATPAPVEIRGDTLFWAFNDLVSSQVEQVSFILQVAGTEFIGDSIRLKALAWLEKSPGVFDAPTISSFSSEIRCAYDPNDKLVVPNRAARYTQNYTLRNEKLEYTIRFQNTGNDTAFTVVVLDTLDQKLDWRTFQMSASSHRVETQLTEGGVLKFTFRNILLPDSTTNEQLSHGFVSFGIAPKVGLPENTGIRNSASIYFDFNPPIKTNATNNVMVTILPQITRTESVQASQRFKVFPNPFNNRFYIQPALPEHDLDAYQLQLWNSQGQLILTRKLSGKLASIDLPDQAAGLYFYVLIDQNAGLAENGILVRK